MNVWIKSVIVALGYFGLLGGVLVGLFWLLENVTGIQFVVGFGIVFFVLVTFGVRTSIFGNE